MKKILGIFLIVVMMFFIAGFVFAENSFVSYSSTSKVGWDITSAEIINNNIKINYMNNLEERDSCKTNERTFMWVPFATEYRGLFLVTLFVPNSFDNESGFDSFLYDNLSDRGKGENETEDTLKKYERYLNSNDPTFMNELNSYVSGDKYFYIVKIEDDFKQNQTYTHNIDLSIINELDKFGKVYIYLYDHCGSVSSFYHNDYKISKNLAKAVYNFSDGQEEISKKESSTSIKLSSSIEDNKIKLDSNVTSNVTIYYTLDNFNLENHLKSKFVEFNNDKEKLKKYLSSNSWNINQSGVNFIVTKYTAPVSLSSGQKLNAIAVDFKNLVLSNYLDGITLSSSESSQSSSLNKFSINFKEDIKTDNVICEKETKICYYNNWSNIDVVVKKAFNDKPVYFSINDLTIDYTDKFSIQNSGELSSNQISLGTGNYFSENTAEFTINNISKNNYFLAAGQIGSNVDYLFFVYVEDFKQIVEYKILQKIVNDAYCTTFDCKIPGWMPYNILTPANQDPVCEQKVKDDGKVEKESCKSRENPKLEFSCDGYTSNLRKNLNIFNLTQNTDGRSYGDILTSQMNNITINPNNQSKFNNVVLDVSKGYKFTDEETVQFISILAQESTFGTKVEGGLNEYGFAQIHYDAWFGDSTKISNGKNQLKSYLKIILDNKDNLSDENIKNIITTNDLYDYVNQTIVGYRNYKSLENLNKMNYATTVFGGAIYLYNRDQILNNGNNFPRASFSTYDDKDSIDALFASASKYVTPKTGFNIKTIMIAGGLITHGNALKTIYKMAYYLSYKKYICENENNFFNITLNKSISNTTSKSTNVNLSEVLPVKKNLTDEQIKNELLGKTEYQNFCATFAREAGNYIFNYNPPLKSDNAWYFGNSNQVILKVNNETEINPNNLVPGSILGIKIGNKDFYDTKEDGRLEDLPYTHVVLYVGNFDGKQNVVFDGGWTNNNVKSFYKTFDQYFRDHPTYDLKEVILPKDSVNNEQKAYLSECIKSKNKFCNYYT